ncbi:MAG: hypothetical protein HY675_28505 [Chloroflexi bacterium]|nr:hypothetical protein [Chloroflexota bacterium]
MMLRCAVVLATLTTLVLTSSSSTIAQPYCAWQPGPQFANVYAVPDLSARLGCPVGPDAPVQLARESFQRGTMIWRADWRHIYVILHAGRWSVYDDTYQEGEFLGSPGSPDGGLVAPDRGFGKLWRQRSEVRDAVGWATATEAGIPGRIQEFAGGRMVWTGDRVIYVLLFDGAWVSYSDTYVYAPVPPPQPLPPPLPRPCEFRLGFKALRDQIPEVVGSCLENDWFNPLDGNVVQRTTAYHGLGGLLVWRKADNWTAFTDGYWTWVNGPFGIQRRLNSERFDWERD